ncbi:MAG: ATP-dependent zinc metalloprotease FtsH [Acidimicrobiia bacterium]|nr:ATP-dependent zinc metalloprotease FtsH [Acidimicrobiia bacterium]
MSPRIRTALVIASVAVFGVVLAGLLWNPGARRTELTLDKYLGKLAAGQVETATIHDSTDRVEGELADDTSYTVSYPADYADELTAQLAGAPNGVQISAASGPGGILGRLVDWGGAAIPYVVLLVAVGIVVYFSLGDPRRALRRMSLRRTAAHPPRDSYADVAGLDEAIDELDELTAFLSDPRRFREIGARIPKGILLCGPPGCGKTLLARATAGEAGVPFYSLSGSDFVEMYVGVGAARMRDLFQHARAHAPAIVFLDEIDTVGVRRGAEDGEAGRERDQTLNQLLVEMDGSGTGLVVLAATNRPEMLDPALLRPGRFDRRISIELPDLEGRRQILELRTRRVPVASDVDLESIARHTAGFSGADLANVVNEAALLAARSGSRLVGARWFEEAVDRILAGPERAGRIASPEERRITAVHEAGHAVVAKATPGPGPVHKVSIVGRDRALGMTVTAPSDDRDLRTRSELVADLVVLLAGRAAETVVCGEPSSAAAEDIARATRVACRMVCELGMSETLGPRRVVPNEAGGEVPSEMSAALAARVDDEITRLLAEASARAVAVVMAHREAVEELAAELLEHETVHDMDLAHLLSRVETPDPGTPAIGWDITDESGVVDARGILAHEVWAGPETAGEQGDPLP